MITALRRMEG